jgi:UDP-N-acetylmuramoylalanine--D-glutamate ligase
MAQFEERVRSGTAAGARVLVLGFGAEGESAVRFLVSRGCIVTVHDTKPEAAFSAERREAFAAKGVIFQFGTPVPEGEFDVVLRSPGIRTDAPAVAAYRARRTPMTSATNLFFTLCPGTIVGVTGTKGKGTTTTIIYEILRVAGRRAVLCGNIGTPMLDTLSEITTDTVVVLELSSFQLIEMEQSPHVAVVLMTTEDHLDFHASTEDYVQAKMQITRFQSRNDITVYSSDYSASARIARAGNGKKYEVSTWRAVPQGCFVREDDIVFTDDGSEVKLASTSDIQIPGRHNLENVCAAVAAAKILALSDDAIQAGLRKFHGLEHRLEFVREVNGVKYYNDSFSTNPSSSVAAVQAFPGGKVLILGGSPKGSDFRELAQAVKADGKVRAILGMGEEWGRIKDALNLGHALYGIRLVEGLSTMPELVRAAHAEAKPGDVVILSPACASFGLFHDYKDRGKQFKEAVTGL